MAGVFEHHDRRRFETIAVSFGPDDGSPMRVRLVQAFEHFIDARGKSDLKSLQLLRRDEIDIAVDLDGYTADAAAGNLALRPAPVQVNYLGFPGTMGAAYIDYILADRIVIPEDEQSHYSEKIVYLPDTYHANDATRRIADARPSRAEAGLPEDGFRLLLLQQQLQIHAGDVRRLDAAVAGGGGQRAVAAARTTRPRCAICARRRARGVIAPTARVRAASLPMRGASGAARLADLFLDTLPYNAHTHRERRAVGGRCRLLTCTGDTFAGRVGGEPAARARAARTDRAIARRLRSARAASSRAIRALAAHQGEARATATRAAFDTARFTRNLEAAYPYA